MPADLQRLRAMRATPEVGIPQFRPAKPPRVDSHPQHEPRWTPIDSR